MKTSNYNCSQAALYQVAQNVYQSLTNNLTAFQNFKTKYTQAQVDLLKAEIATAEAIPDKRGRSAQTEVDYIKLCDQLEACITLWQTIKRYTLAAYTEAEQKPRLEEAGYTYYTKASNRNWDSARALFLAGKMFITQHTVELEANQNMPATFITHFDTEYNKFMALLTTFQQSTEKIGVDTNLKIDANNKIYDSLMEVCYDGQIIFKNNEPVKDMFTFAHVLSIVSGKGTSGFKGYIIDAKTNQPLAGVSITSTGFTKAVVTDEDGFYEMLQIAEGKYPIAFNMAGYNTHTIADYSIDSGVVHSLNINLTPIGS